MTVEQSGDMGLKKRRITLKDGRYMIFYTFEDQRVPSPEGAEAALAEAEPKPQAEDECSV